MTKIRLQLKICLSENVGLWGQFGLPQEKEDIIGREILHSSGLTKLCSSGSASSCLLRARSVAF